MAAPVRGFAIVEQPEAVQFVFFCSAVCVQHAGALTAKTEKVL